MRDFTSIVTHLAKDCMEHKEHESFLSNNLRGQGVKIFPSHHRVWVSLSDCLLENDDPKLAKTFSKVGGVHFVQWPSKFTEKGKHWNQGQMMEEKDEFLRICNIPKLSEKVRQRIHHDGITLQMDTLKSKISLWVPLIQKFLFHYCKDQYSLLLESGIVERLSRLQVLTAAEIKCLYYIEHEGRHLESPEPAARVCVLEIDVSEIPTIYVAEKKKDKTPSFLHAPFLQLFAQGMGDKDESAFMDFLSRLLSDLPEDADDIEGLTKEYSLSQLGEAETEWRVPLPKVALVEEESSSEEEEDDEEVRGLQEGIAMEETSARDDGDRPMTSWPPKAAIDPAPSSKKRRDPGTAASQGVAGGSSGAGVIGEDELQEMRKKHALENEQAPTSPVHPPMHDVTRLGGPRDSAGQDSPQNTPREGPRNAPREVVGGERGGIGEGSGSIQQGEGERGERCCCFF